MLALHNIPYTVLGHPTLFQSSEVRLGPTVYTYHVQVQDLLSFFRILDDPHHPTAFSNALRLCSSWTSEEV